MSRSLAAVVPEPLVELLAADPGDARADGFTLLLLTVRDDGWPHQAMLSVGEVVLLGGGDLRLALWPASTSTRNLRARERATLTAVVEEVSYALRLELRERVTSAAPLAVFDARVVAATADEAPYARLTSGVRYELTDRAATIARWRETRARLRAGPEAGAGAEAVP